MANDHVVEVIVRVSVATQVDHPEAHAVEMVKDALADRAPKWSYTTFVREGDVRAAS
jgi:hypothetical protein